MYKDIEAFHKHFDLHPHAGPVPCLLPPDVMQFRLNFLHEECLEMLDAYDAKKLPEVADAIVDLVYVALGTAYLMGLPFDNLWNVVHAANMKKVRVQSADDSKRGHHYDVKKPEGWKAPDIEGVLRDFGWMEGI